MDRYMDRLDQILNGEIRRHNQSLTKMNEQNKIILYQDDNEITRVSVRFADEDLWLTQNQLVEIYQTSKSNVSEHIKHILRMAS